MSFIVIDKSWLRGEKSENIIYIIEKPASLIDHLESFYRASNYRICKIIKNSHTFL